MALIGKIRAMHERDRKSISEISRLTSLSRNTIKKWLRAPREAPAKYRREPVPCKLSPFVEAIGQALEADARRPKKERRTARALLKQIRDDGYEGGYSRLTDFEPGICASGYVRSLPEATNQRLAGGEAQTQWSQSATVAGRESGNLLTRAIAAADTKHLTTHLRGSVEDGN